MSGVVQEKKKESEREREGDVKMSGGSYEVGATSHMGP